MKDKNEHGYFLYPDGFSAFGINVARFGEGGLKIKRKTHEVLKRFNTIVAVHVMPVAQLMYGSKSEVTVPFNFVAAKVYARVTTRLNAIAAAKAKAAQEAEKALPKPKVEKKAK